MASPSDSSAAEERIENHACSKPRGAPRWRPAGSRLPSPPEEGHAAPVRSGKGTVGRLFLPPRSTADIWSDFQHQRRSGFLSPEDGPARHEMRTPSPSATSSYTPSLASPGSASASSYFSIQYEPTTPVSENAPSNAFFRLALHSPPIQRVSQDPFEKAASRYIASGLVCSAAHSTAVPSTQRAVLPSFAELTNGVGAPGPLALGSHSISAPSSPTSRTRTASHRLPSLCNLLNPDPVTLAAPAPLKRSLSADDRSFSTVPLNALSPPPSSRRPSYKRRLSSYPVQLAPIMSRSPSCADLQHGPEEASAYRGVSPDPTAALGSSAPLNNTFKRVVSPQTAPERAGLGILAAAADFVSAAE